MKMILLNTIKGTALNKGSARTWVESVKLARFGFHWHAPVTITFNDDNITITLDDAGSREVAGRSRNGKEIPILDICYPVAQRNAMFNGADKLAVNIDQGIIIITAA
jgi:hypothetical protein